MYLDNFLNEAWSQISKRNDFHERNSKKLLPLKNMISPNKIENFVVPIKQIKFSCKIAGVDSGFVSKRLSFMDLILIKVGGVIFTYDNSILKKAEYYPSPVKLPQPKLLKSGLEKDEEQQSISLERLRKEIENSIKIIIDFSPKYLFIDGSIIPQYQDKPRTDSKINSDYNSIIDLFQKMYLVAQEKNCTLISTIEDSRGNRFKQILIDFLKSKDFTSLESIENSSDSSILDYLLLKGERTFAFAYTSLVSSHAILKDYLQEFSESIFVFYLKASDFDGPLRVEFICKDKNNLDSLANEIASITFALSSIHKEYSYPSVLIEADLRARLTYQDISIVYEKLIDKLGPKMKLRRNSRPFA